MMIVPCAESFAVSVLSAGTVVLNVFVIVTTVYGRSPVPFVAVNEPLTEPVWDIGVTFTSAPAKAYSAPAQTTMSTSTISAVP